MIIPGERITAIIRVGPVQSTTAADYEAALDDMALAPARLVLLRGQQISLTGHAGGYLTGGGLLSPQLSWRWLPFAELAG